MLWTWLYDIWSHFVFTKISRMVIFGLAFVFYYLISFAFRFSKIII